MTNKINDKEFISKNWTDADGNHQGGQTYGPGFCIAWQRGPIAGLEAENQNGALLITVLHAAADQIKYFQDSKFKSSDNEEALLNISKAIKCLERRKTKRASSGKLGTHEV